jgi:putative FmdB family regulatory protein
MPIFEFRCERCGREFERLVLSSSEGAAACPGCGCTETRKVLSSFACGGGVKKSIPSCSHAPSSGNRGG